MFSIFDGLIRRLNFQGGEVRNVPRNETTPKKSTEFSIPYIESVARGIDFPLPAQSISSVNRIKASAVQREPGSQPLDPDKTVEVNEDGLAVWSPPTLPIKATEKADSSGEKPLGVATALEAAVVVDGMGGHANASEATKVALLAMKAAINLASVRFSDAYISKLHKTQEDKEALDQLGINIVTDALFAGHNAVVRENGGVYGGLQKDSNDIMGAVATAVVIHEFSKGERTAYIANVGDTRAYKIDAQGNLIEISVDDNTFLDMIDSSTVERFNDSEKNILISLSGISAQNSGEKDGLLLYKRQLQRIVSKVLSLEHLRHMQGLFGDQSIIAVHLFQAFSNRRSVSQYLGMVDSNVKTRPPLVVSTHTVSLKQNEEILVCSDGLFDNLTFGEIQNIINLARYRGVPVVPLLVELAKQRSMDKEHFRAKPDDITVYYSGDLHTSTQSSPESKPKSLLKVGEAVQVTRKGSGQIEDDWYVYQITDQGVVVNKNGTNITKEFLISNSEYKLLLSNRIDIASRLTSALSDNKNRLQAKNALIDEIRKLGAIRSYNNVYSADYLVEKINQYFEAVNNYEESQSGSASNQADQEALNLIPRAFNLRMAVERAAKLPKNAV